MNLEKLVPPLELCQKIPADEFLENWLNAPADCVKQNGKNDTQADLCKADNTESEMEDE